MEEVTLEAIELPPGEKAHPVAAAAGRVPDRLRSGDPCGAIHRRQGRADARAPEPLARLQQCARADRHHRDAPRPAAPVAREPHRRARAAGRVDRRRHAPRAARPAEAVPHREAAAHQPDLPRHLSHRHARRRPAPEDHQPDIPVHRPQGLDRALRARRRSRRLRPRAGAFPRAATRSSPPRRARWSRRSATP